MKNQSEKPEERFPQDSKRKKIKSPEDTHEAVVRPEDQEYTAEEANFKNVAKYKEEREQPVHPVKQPPKDV